MSEPSPNVVAAFAAFVRARLRDVAAPLAPLLGAPPARRREAAMVIVAAAAPFAPTAQARARLLRQAHASGLLSARETDAALEHSGGTRRAIGAPQP